MGSFAVSLWKAREVARRHRYRHASSSTDAIAEAGLEFGLFAPIMTELGFAGHFGQSRRSLARGVGGEGAMKMCGPQHDHLAFHEDDGQRL